MPEIRPEIETIAKIRVVGVGGAGGAAVNRMIASKIKGVEFIAVNTDLQALHQNEAKLKLHIGHKIARGLGAGMDPEVGFQAAQENVNEIRDLLKGSDMVFITCGLGGGTGTGASPLIAQVAREIGALVVAVVTKPFVFEGAQRLAIAERGLRELRDRVDTIITIPNEKILQIIDKKTSLLDAFKNVDDVLRQGIQGISEIITIPALINVDFADVKSIMSEAGSALMSIGEGSGENRATIAAKGAISSPLLDISIDGAKGVLFVIYGGPSLTMNEVNEAASIITESVDSNAKIIFGAVIDDSMKDKIKITLVATGFGETEAKKKAPEAKYSINKMFTGKKIAEEREDKESRFAKIEKKEEEPIISSIASQASQNIQPMPSEFRPKPAPTEEDDLEIPAFIRKKMK